MNAPTPAAPLPLSINGHLTAVGPAGQMALDSNGSTIVVRVETLRGGLATARSMGRHSIRRVAPFLRDRQLRARLLVGDRCVAEAGAEIHPSRLLTLLGFPALRVHWAQLLKASD